MGKSIGKGDLRAQPNGKAESQSLSVRHSSASTIRTSCACTSSRVIFTSHQHIWLHPNQLLKVGCMVPVSEDVNFPGPTRPGRVWTAAVRRLVVLRTACLK